MTSLSLSGSDHTVWRPHMNQIGNSTGDSFSVVQAHSVRVASDKTKMRASRAALSRLAVRPTAASVRIPSSRALVPSFHATTSTGGDRQITGRTPQSPRYRGLATPAQTPSSHVTLPGSEGSGSAESSDPGPSMANLPASTDLLEVYRGLVAQGKLSWDEEQVRIVMKV
jgi:hypothetical protein